MNNFEYKEKYKYLSSGCLNLTDACNLACKYCFVEQHPHYMTYQIAQDAIDFYINNLRKKKSLNLIKEDAKSTVTFFGGEPTLLWDEIIVPLVHYTNLNYKNEINFTITSNATLLNEEKIKFLADNNISLLLSIDGNKESQDFNRPTHDGKSSFDLLEKNLPLIIQYLPNTTFRSTITPYSAKYIYSNYLYAADLGFKNIFMMPNGREQWTIEDKNILKQEIEKLYTLYACCFINNFFPPLSGWLDDALEEILVRDMAAINNRDIRQLYKNVERCGLGTTYSSIGYDGNIYGCQEQTSRDEKNIFLIGNIYTGIDQEKHYNLLNKFYNTKNESCINNENCKNCLRKEICSAASCPSTNWDLHQCFNKTNDINCFWHELLFEKALNLMNFLVEENNETFKHYLNIRCNFSQRLGLKEE